VKRIWAACGILGTLSLLGCGGGSSSLSTGTRGTGKATVLITDSFREDFAHVWATIYHVELVPQAGTNNGANVVLYDNPTGIQIDLKTLRDSTGARFSFLGSNTIPAGTYTAITVTVGPTMQLFKNGVATGSPLTVDTTLPKDANGNPILTDTFKTPKTFGASTTNNLIVDFNLANFIVRGSNVIPSIQDGDPTGVGDPNRHNPCGYQGTVSNLSGTSPALTFTLTYANGSTATVTTTASTALFGATLANGSVVNVTGTLDTTTQMLVATEVDVKPTGTAVQAPQGANGTASALNATAGTFTLTVNRANGFTPAQTTVNVVTTSTTTYRSDAGATLAEADFFTALTTTTTVSVRGTYDATSNTLTATDLRIDNTANDGGWEHDQHNFRPGAGPNNWGNGAFPGPGGGH